MVKAIVCKTIGISVVGSNPTHLIVMQSHTGVVDINSSKYSNKIIYRGEIIPYDLIHVYFDFFPTMGVIRLDQLWSPHAIWSVDFENYEFSKLLLIIAYKWFAYSAHNAQSYDMQVPALVSAENIYIEFPRNIVKTPLSRCGIFLFEHIQLYVPSKNIGKVRLQDMLITNDTQRLGTIADIIVPDTSISTLLGNIGG